MPNSRDSTPSGNTSAAPRGPWQAIPRHMYIHYLPQKEAAQYEAFLFARETPDAEITLDEVKRYVSMIEAGNGPVVKPGHNRVEWRVFSYIVFVLNDPDGKILQTDALHFEHHETKSNHSFFNEQYLGEWNSHSVSCCINYRLDKNKWPLGDLQEDEYHWQVLHTDGKPSSAVGEARLHNDSGSNVGP